MKNKTTYILGGLFVLLILLFFVTSYHPKEKTKGAEYLFKGKKPAIEKIEVIRANGELVTLEKHNEIWDITKPVSYKASAPLVAEVLRGFQAILVDGVVTSDVNEQKRFGVEDSTATNLILYSGGTPIIDVFIGRHRPDLTHTYVRAKGSNDIVLWRGAYSWIVSRDLDDWRDRTVYNFNAVDVTKVTAVSGKSIRTLSLTDSTWTYTENGRSLSIDQEMAMQVAAMIGALSCDSFAKGKDFPRAASTKPDTRISFAVRNGDTHSFDLWTPGPGDGGRYLARKKDGDILFAFNALHGSILGLGYETLKPGSQEAFQQMLQQQQMMEQQRMQQR